MAAEAQELAGIHRFHQGNVKPRRATSRLTALIAAALFGRLIRPRSDVTLNLSVPEP